jgi:Cu/Ag efflux protein CusF
MLKGKLKTCILAACFLFVSVAAIAQEVVHALTGTVTFIDASAKTITIYTDNRSDGFFKDMTNSNTSIEFDKDIRANATAVDSFKMKGAYVIVFYFGEDDVRTAVALRSLGAGPFSKDTGTVVKIEGKNSISITDESGAMKSFKLTSSTVAETEYGAVIGSKYQPHKGDKVSMTATAVNGNATALFINTLLAN